MHRGRNILSPFNQKVTASVVATAVAVAIAGCATMDNMGDQYGRTAVGCVGGALLGGVIGALAEGEKGAAKGAAIGLAVGCAAGHLWDEREKELQQLAKDEQMRIQIERVYAQQGDELRNQPANAQAPVVESKPESVGLVAQVEDSAMFASGSAMLTPDGQRQLEKLADILVKARQKEGTQNSPVLVIGHTDATGSAKYNQTLSEQRAQTVVELLAARGIAREHLFYQGAGEGRPLATNDTDAGRTANRRVELVELKDEQVLAARIRAEQQNARYLQHSTVEKLPAVTAPAQQSSAPSQPEPATEVASSQAAESATEVAAEAPATDSVTTPTPTAKGAAAKVDFGGQPATLWPLSTAFIPDYSGGFGLISSVIADASLVSCADDAPRMVGQVKNLAGKTMVSDYSTSEFLPGMNGKVWAAKVNGHVVYVNPVAILEEDAAVAQQPKVALTENYDRGVRDITGTYDAVATTYKGKDNLLMRVFLEGKDAPLQCVDLLLPYGGVTAQKGALYYGDSGQAMVADYLPRNTSAKTAQQ